MIIITGMIIIITIELKGSHVKMFSNATQILDRDYPTVVDANK